MEGSSDGDSEDGYDLNNWTEVRRNKRVRNNSSIEGSSSDGRKEGRVVRRREDEDEGFKLILSFKEGNYINDISLLEAGSNCGRHNS